MSSLEQRTRGRREAVAEAPAGTAVIARSLAAEATGGSQILPAADWPAIDTGLPDGCRAPVPAFPLELLPAPWRAWAGDAARSSAAPVDYVVQALLAAVAGAGGRRVLVIPTPGWQEPLRLWLAAVGAPSTGKSPALASVRRLLLELESELMATGEGSLPRRRMVLGDGRFDGIAAMLASDPRGMVLWRDGPSGCLAPLGDRRGVQHLEPYGLSIVGSLDPDGIDRMPGARPPGPMARFLYAWPQPLPFQPLAGCTVLPGDEVLAPLRRIVQAFGALAGPHGLFLDEPAARAFDAFRARLHEETKQAKGLEAAWLGKGGGAVASLAGTFALLSWSAAEVRDLPDRVDLDSVERAIALWSSYYRPHARAFLERSGPADRQSRVQRVMRWLRSDGRPTLSREDVRRTALGDTVDASEADGVIARLVEAGVVRPLPRMSGPQGGRPAVRWQVNPRLSRGGSAQTAGTSQT